MLSVCLLGAKYLPWNQQQLRNIGMHYLLTAPDLLGIYKHCTGAHKPI